MVFQQQKKSFSKEKSFGYTFSVLFFLLSLYPSFKLEDINFYFFVFSFLLLLIVLLAPGWLSLPTNIWFKFGKLLSTITSPVIMFIIFFFVIMPISLIFKIFKKNLLLKAHEEDSYWSERDSSGTDMKQQF